jgi:hypothetical protein
VAAAGRGLVDERSMAERASRDSVRVFSASPCVRKSTRVICMILNRSHALYLFAQRRVKKGSFYSDLDTI